MCGILGFYSSGASHESWLKDGLAAISHRGPDDEGTFYSKSQQIGLAHARLSIIDLSPGGHQPMSTEDGRLHIVFNGEIYNYKELKTRLEAKGIRFRSTSDTEVLLKLYEEKGEKCIQDLRGMFSFVIWDERNQSLFLSRDPFGIKPLYFTQTPQGFFFSSEIKPLLKSPGYLREADWSHLDDYLTFLYVPSPHTLFKNIQRLSPGHCMTISSKGQRQWSYWDYPLAIGDWNGGQDPVEKLLASLKDTVEAHLVSDVPVGLYLSGGLDSSVIAAVSSKMLGHRLRSFTLKMEDKDRRYESGPDDAAYAAWVAKDLGLEHTVISLDPKIEELIDKVITSVEEPIADPSSVASYLLCQEAGKSGLKVLLSGIGGDELFGGYPRHIAGKISSTYRRIPGFIRHGMLEPLFSALPAGATGGVGVMSRRLKALSLSGSLPFDEGYIGYSSYGFPQAYRKPLYQSTQQFPSTPNAIHRAHMKVTEGHDPLQRMLYLDLKTFQPDQNLNHLDKTSMAHSIEVRVPFVDRPFVESALSIPPNLRLRGITTKYILKKAGERILPKEVIWRKKSVFTIPTRSWLRGALRPWVEDTLSEQAVKNRGLFDPKYVRQLITEFNEGKADHHLRLWTLMTLELWARKFLDSNN